MDFNAAQFDALEHGHLEDVKGFAASWGETELSSALIHAAEHNQMAIVKWLAVNGAEVPPVDWGLSGNGSGDMVRWINAFRGRQTLKEGVRAWMVISRMIKKVAESQYAPGCPGAVRLRAEFEDFQEQLPGLVMVEAFGEIGVLSETKGTRPRLV